MALPQGVDAGHDSQDQGWGRRFGDKGAPGTNESDCTQVLNEVLDTLLAVMLQAVVQAVMAVVSTGEPVLRFWVWGPGLWSWPAALVAVRTGQVLKLTVQETCSRLLLRCSQQILLEPCKIIFLRLPLGANFSNTKGNCHNGHFFTWIGVFQDHQFSLLERKGQQPAFLLRSQDEEGSPWENSLSPVSAP